ncbi:MAG TPA: hypothetical protein VF495_12870 [Phenylobacterium sp.]
MKTLHAAIAGLGLAAGAALLATTPSHSQAPAPAATITPVPIPDGADFPVAQATIDGWVSAGDTGKIRGHAWALWAAMTAKSGQSFNGQELPIWETWDGFADVFATTVPVSAAGGRTLRPVRGFQRPLQFHHPVNGVVTAGAADNAHIVADNKFDPVASAFITAKQAGPGGVTYSYASQSSLNKLNAAWPPGTSGQARAINDFPVRAIELKPVFGRVKAAGLTVQPLWRGPAGATNKVNPTPDTWTTCVLVDPAGQGALRAATAAEITAANASGSACKTFLYGPLTLFYAVRLTADEAANFEAASGSPTSGGDYAVLLGLHANTKEIPFWTWQTFWWQPGADTPGGFPGSKVGQPASVTGPWKNYATCANYDQTTKPGGKVMQVCFNPYLETSPGIPAGIQSNCMSCHGTARIAANSGYPTSYKGPIAFFSDAKYFNSASTHTDFSWAIPSAP